MKSNKAARFLGDVGEKPCALLFCFPIPPPLVTGTGQRGSAKGLWQDTHSSGPIPTFGGSFSTSYWRFLGVLSSPYSQVQGFLYSQLFREIRSVLMTSDCPLPLSWEAEDARKIYLLFLGLLPQPSSRDSILLKDVLWLINLYEEVNCFQCTSNKSSRKIRNFIQEKRRNIHIQPIIQRQPLLTFWFISFPSFVGFFYTVNHIKHFSCFNIITKAFSTVLILVNIILSVILLKHKCIHNIDIITQQWEYCLLNHILVWGQMYDIWWNTYIYIIKAM